MRFKVQKYINLIGGKETWRVIDTHANGDSDGKNRSLGDYLTLVAAEKQADELNTLKSSVLLMRLNDKVAGIELHVDAIETKAHKWKKMLREAKKERDDLKRQLDAEQAIVDAGISKEVIEAARSVHARAKQLKRMREHQRGGGGRRRAYYGLDGLIFHGHTPGRTTFDERRDPWSEWTQEQRAWWMETRILGWCEDLLQYDTAEKTHEWRQGIYDLWRKRRDSNPFVFIEETS